MSEPPAPEVVVYTQPHCAGCRDVERFLELRGIRFTVRDVSAEAAALEEIVGRGYMSTPVIRIGDRWIAGFNRKALEAILYC